MNLTFKQVQEYSPALELLINSSIIEDMDDAILIGSIKKPLEEAQEARNRGRNAIVFKYSKLAEKRSNEKNPGGYNTVAEKENEINDVQKLNEKICKTNFDFKPLKKDTVVSLYKGVTTKDKDGNIVKVEKLTPSMLQSLIDLELHTIKK